MSTVTGYRIKKPRPVFRRALRKAPAAPLDDRVLVRENPPEAVTEGGLHVPEKEQQRCMHGVLVAAGDTAADYLYDRNVELEDTVLYARYAGVVEEWQHIVGDDDPKCEHDGAWEHVGPPSGTLTALNPDRQKEDAARARKWELVGGPNENISLRECRACGTLIATERLLVMSCKDILMSVEGQERIESGAVTRYRGVDPEGKTSHYLVRTAFESTCYGGIEPPAKLKGAA